MVILEQSGLVPVRLPAAPLAELSGPRVLQARVPAAFPSAALGHPQPPRRAPRTCDAFVRAREGKAPVVQALLTQPRFTRAASSALLLSS